MGYFGTLSDAQVDTFVSTDNFAALIAAFIGLADASFGTSFIAPGLDGFYEATETGLYRHDDNISAVDPSPAPADSYSLLNLSGFLTPNP